MHRKAILYSNIILAYDTFSCYTINIYIKLQGSEEMEFLIYGSTAVDWNLARKSEASKAPQTSISPEATRESSALPQDLTGAMPPVEGKNQSEKDGALSNRRNQDTYECQTCKNRKYQDGSDDPGVSFKTPTKINPTAVTNAVRSHEMEHVSREQQKAQREGREVVSQTVTMKTAICPECGKTYTSGGETRTVTRNKQELEKLFQVGLEENDKQSSFSFLA